jgi:host factor-I protein
VAETSSARAARRRFIIRALLTDCRFWPNGAAQQKCYIAPWRPAKNRAPGNEMAATKRPNSKWGKLMAADKAQNLQDTFLNHVRKSKTSVTIFLVNGVKLQGFVTWFDNFCVLLRRDGHSQLVYKHAISTIMPAAPIQMFEAVEEGAADHH